VAGAAGARRGTAGAGGGGLFAHGKHKKTQNKKKTQSKNASGGAAPGKGASSWGGRSRKRSGVAEIRMC